MPNRPSYSHTPGQGRPQPGPRQELTQAFASGGPPQAQASRVAGQQGAVTAQAQGTSTAAHGQAATGATGTDATGNVFHNGVATALSVNDGIAATVPLAKLTTGGTNGSLTFNDQGRLVAYTPPT